MFTPISEQALRERIGAKVRALRNKLGFTLKIASQRAEIHWRHWQKIEAAQVNVTLWTLVRLGEALMTDPMELVRI